MIAGILVAILVVWLTQQSATLLTRLTFQWLVALSVLPAILAVLLLIVGVRAVQAASQQGVEARAPGRSRRYVRALHHRDCALHAGELV
ncbi:MAG: hypothetical protein R2851_08180 [Caldilineaceae bacterium]